MIIDNHRRKFGSKVLHGEILEDLLSIDEDPEVKEFVLDDSWVLLPR